MTNTKKKDYNVLSGRNLNCVKEEKNILFSTFSRYSFLLACHPCITNFISEACYASEVHSQGQINLSQIIYFRYCY